MTMIVWVNSFWLFLLYLRIVGAKWFFEFGQSSQGTRILRTTGLVEIPWIPEIQCPKSLVCTINLWDKSLGTSTSYFEYFAFTCGDKNPLKFVKSTKYYDHDFLRKQILPVSALSTLLGAKWFFEFGQRAWYWAAKNNRTYRNPLKARDPKS